MKTKLLLLVLAVLLTSPSSWASPDSEDLSDLNALLETLRAASDLPALAGAIIHKGEVIAIGAVGIRKSGSEEVVTTDDLWHLGSCTKAMTSTMIGALVERGDLSWDTTIGDVFSDFEEIREEWLGVTLEQLLTHRSGLPEDRVPDALFFKLRELEGPIREQRVELVKLALAREPAATPGSTMAYSNTGYTIAGAMAEAVTGSSWEDLLQEHLFEPLGMTTVGFGPPGKADSVLQPFGHRGVLPVDPGLFGDNPPVIGPAGTIHASLGDWAKFVAAHLAGERGKSDLLTAKTFTRLHTPAEGQDYAFGWLVTEREWAGGRTLVHDGSNGLWYAVVWIAPERDMAILVTTNTGGAKAAKATDAAVSNLVVRFYAMTTRED